MVMSLIGKALMGMLLKLLTSQALEDFIVFALEKAAAMSPSKVDDELVAKVKQHLADKA